MCAELIGQNIGPKWKSLFCLCWLLKPKTTLWPLTLDLFFFLSPVREALVSGWYSCFRVSGISRLWVRSWNNLSFHILQYILSTFLQMPGLDLSFHWWVTTWCIWTIDPRIVNFKKIKRKTTAAESLLVFYSSSVSLFANRCQTDLSVFGGAKLLFALWNEAASANSCDSNVSEEGGS